MQDVGLAINHNLIAEIKNTGSQLTLRIECVKRNFNFLFEGALLMVRLLAHNDDFVFKQSYFAFSSYCTIKVCILLAFLLNHQYNKTKLN